MLQKLNRWVDNPTVKLLVGVILFTTWLCQKNFA